MKKVSTGKSPYQITMYCANSRYIQNTEKAKTILPKSCMTVGFVNRLFSPKRPRSTTAVRAIAVNPLQKHPAKKSYPQKWRERLAEPIRRRTAPLCLRQIERRRRDHRALRNAKEEQQIDEIGFPCDRGSASQQRRHERDRAEDDHSARHLLHRRASHRLDGSRLHRRAFAMCPLKLGAHRGCAPSSRTTSSAPDS